MSLFKVGDVLQYTGPVPIKGWRAKVITVGLTDRVCRPAILIEIIVHPERADLIGTHALVPVLHYCLAPTVHKTTVVTYRTTGGSIRSWIDTVDSFKKTYPSLEVLKVTEIEVEIPAS